MIYSPGRSPWWNIGPRSPGGGDLVNHAHGLCLDAAANATTTNGDTVQLWSCWGGANQHWVRVGNEIVNEGGGLCLDATAGGVGTNGDRIQLWSCTGGANQQWIQVGLELVNQASGKCLDAAAQSDFRDGGTVQLWSCVGSGNINQLWIQDHELVNQSHGLCLDAAANATTTNGARVQMWSCWGGPNQQWLCRPPPAREPSWGSLPRCRGAEQRQQRRNRAAVAVPIGQRGTRVGSKSETPW